MNRRIVLAVLVVNLGGFTAAPEAAEPCRIDGVRFLYPEAGVGWKLDFGQTSDRFSLQYRLRVTVAFPRQADYLQPVVRIDGREYRPEQNLFCPQIGQERNRILGRLLRKGTMADFDAFVNWQEGQRYTVQFSAQESGEGTPVVESPPTTAVAPAGGYWDVRWRHYIALGITETAGLARRGWPVEVTLTAPASQMAHPEREVRVCAIDPIQGTTQEVVSQAWHVGDWNLPQPPGREPDRTINVVFLADLPARETRVYGIFFDRPDAPEPHYETDLRVVGPSLGGTVENRYYNITLDQKSGQIGTVRLKERPKARLYFAQGPIHWNPDIYAPGLAPWSHTMEWNPPPHRVEIRGPVLYRTTRWGPMPGVPQASASVTYTFYAGQPFIQESSVVNVDRPLGVTALRNNELVFSYGVFTHSAWRDGDGRFGAAPVQSEEKYYGVAQVLGAEDPWMALYHPTERVAMACVNLKAMHRWNEGTAGVATSPFFYCADWGMWGRTPKNFLYMTRWALHSFHLPGEQLMLIPPGSWFAEESAFVPWALSPGGEIGEADFRLLDDLYRILRRPVALLR